MVRSPTLLLVSALSACAPDGQIRLVLGPDQEISDPQQLAAQLRRLEVVVDGAQGLAGVTAAGPREEGGEAKDWDGDGTLELVFSHPHEPGAALPRLELGVGGNAGRLLEFRVLGFGADEALVAYGGASWTPVAAGTKELPVPFNLRPRARPPQVMLSLPADGQREVPDNLSAVTLVFSTIVDEATAAAAVRLSGPLGDEPCDLRWERATLNAGGLLEEQRYLLSLKPRGLLSAGQYTVSVATELKSTGGLGLDQDPRRAGAQPFSSGFEVGLRGIGGPLGCGECGEGFACDDEDRCAALPGCAQGCHAGWVCDPAAARCVEDCGALGLCPEPGSSCDAESGLCG